ncbi:unnamed protein product [Adineta ricciae]|uniref:Uncharacterized protein n=1 Tax=Adineta ricciae TaxID=249248 RepID=A0A815P630_ADIRI|nr:unnamed protein product [Adineta ricciae]CAF1444640.1 unnamed protein product [Adineta ricciae]
MNKLALSICLIFGIVCYTNAQGVTFTTTAPPFTVVCNTITANKATTAAFLQQLTAALQSTGAGSTNFPNSVAYVTNSTNQKELLSGEQGCMNFFNGFLTPFTTDLQNDKVKIVDARQQLSQFLQTKFPNLAAVLPN